MFIPNEFKTWAENLWKSEHEGQINGECSANRVRPSASSVEEVAFRLKNEYKTSVTIIVSEDGQVFFSNFLQETTLKQHIYVFYPLQIACPIHWTFRYIVGKKHNYDTCLWRKVQKALFKKVLFDHVSGAPSNLEDVLEKWLMKRPPAYYVGSLRVLAQRYYEPGNTVVLKHCNVLWEKHLMAKRDAERVIIIQVCHKKRLHSTCFKVFARNLPTVHSHGQGQPCQCCGFLPRVLLTRTFSATLHKASPISQLRGIWPESLSGWMREQYTMMQYVVHQAYPTQIWFYVDMFDGISSPIQRTFQSISLLLDFARERHDTVGNLRKRTFLQNILSIINRIINNMGPRGTFATYNAQLESTIKKRVIIWSQRELLDELGQDLCLWARATIRRRNHASRKNVIYSYTGKGWTIVFAEPLLQSSPSTHMELVAKMAEFLFVMGHHFGYEVVSGGAFSLSLITYKAILFKLSMKSSTHESTSKPSLALLKLFKEKSLHQFLLPVMPYINSGERLRPHGKETLQSLLEADMTLCYSSQVALQSMPIGCPLLYQYNEEKKGLYGARSHPYNKTEYRIVYHLLQTFKRPILKAYHQYSANGPFIAKYMSLDLCIVYSNEQGGVAFSCYNIHHNYTHTCEICGRLDSYISKRTYESVKKKSDEIDTFWKECAEKMENFSFQTIYFCHFPIVIDGQIFQSLEELTPLASQFPPDLRSPSKRALSESRLMQLIRDPNLVVFVIATGCQMHPGYTNGAGSQTHLLDSLESACVFTKNEHNITSLSTNAKKPTLFLGNYMDFLISTRQFALTNIFHVIIYRASKAYQPIFNEMARARELNLPGSSMLKLALNSAIGLFGSCKTNASDTKLVFKSVWQRSWYSTYFLKPTTSPDVFLLERTFDRSTLTSYLMMVHTAILQHYRLSMLRARDELAFIFNPNQFRVLQVHADSFLIGLAGKNLIDCARNPETLVDDMERIFSRQKTAGKFTISSFINHVPFKFFLPGVTKVNIQVDYTQARILSIDERAAFLESYENRYVGAGRVYDNYLVYYSAQK